MKKRFLCLLMACAVSVVPAFATENSYFLPESADYAEISALTSEIVTWVNDTAQEEGLDAQITEADVDFSRAYRIDVDSTVMDLEDTSLTATDEYLAERDSCLWEIPVDIGENTMVVSVTRGTQPDEDAKDTLGEEEYQKLVDGVGKWGLLSVETLDAGQDIPSRTQAVLAENDLTESAEVRYLGGESGIHTVMAIIYEDGTPTKLLPLVGEFSIRDERTKNAAETDYQIDTCYDFAEAQALIRLAEPEDEDSGTALVISGESTHPFRTAVIIVGILIAAGAIFVIYRKKAAKRGGTHTAG